MDLKVSALALIVATLLAACASAPEAAPVIAADDGRAALVAQGRALAETHCRTCHSIGPTGDSPYAEAPPLRTLSERYPVGMLEEAFAEGVLVGHPAMPEFQLEPAQIDALVAFLESIQERRGG
ncbi:MAG: cytochrome c [Hyphomonadaceae bacterium]|nr:cytochrome c [Hyphomonadaceae bacterium]